MVPLVKLFDQIQVNLLVSYLEAHNVTSHTSSDNAGGLEPQLTIMTGVTIYVPETQLYRAQKLLEEFNNAEHAIDENFTGD